MKLYWAKVREDAVIPAKRKEDAGYDLYPCFEEDYLEILPHETRMIPLGVASAFSEDWVMILKERGSTGTKGIAQRAGVIDSGSRGEYLAPVTNTGTKPLRIIKKAALDALSEQEKENLLLYPYEKAVCQGVLLQMPQAETEEISLEELKAMSSQRAEGRLGSSGK